jgi:hypothetical protein
MLVILFCFTVYLSNARGRNLLSKTVNQECVWKNDAESEHCKRLSLDALTKLAKKINHGVVSSVSKLRQFGENWGMHMLVDTGKQSNRCVFYSYGISSDYSFDKQLANDWGCQGFLFDPSVIYPAKLEEDLRFFYMGAPLLTSDLEIDCASGPSCKEYSGWIAVSPPQVMAFLGHKKINVLKMDCEGCEYALARDIARMDADFFSKVDQFAIEVHVSKWWLKDELHLHYLGLLYHMLAKNNLELVHATVGGCSLHHETVGCLQELEAIQYPCGITKSCHNYLFARVKE